jgi:hypothetical protein
MIGDGDGDPFIHGQAPLLSLIASSVGEVFWQLDAHLVNLPLRIRPSDEEVDDGDDDALAVGAVDEQDGGLG